MYYRIAVLSLFLLASPSFASVIPTEIGWPLQKAYVPKGFDDNDKVQITVAGEFPNTCFRVGSYTTKVDEAAKVIYLRQNAYSYSTMCLDILIPFAQTIDVGLVPAGEYKIIDSATKAQIGRTVVDRATNPGPDDFLYAVVDDASIRTVSGQPGKSELSLSLQFTNRCTKLKQVDVHYSDDVIVVQPILTYIENSSDEDRCGPIKTRFQYTQPIAEGVKGNYLLHVRSMNGQAVNKLVYVE